MGLGQQFQARGRFNSLHFYKTPKEIIAAARARREKVLEKIKEREARIDEICKEHGLGAADLLANLDEFNTHNMTTAFVSEGELPPMKAGKKAQLVEEAQQIHNEKAVAEELRLIAEHLSDEMIAISRDGVPTRHPVSRYELTFDELRYFGF